MFPAESSFLCGVMINSSSWETIQNDARIGIWNVSANYQGRRSVPGAMPEGREGGAAAAAAAMKCWDPGTSGTVLGS